MIAYTAAVAGFWLTVISLTLLGCRAVDFVTACAERRRRYLLRTRA